MKQKKILKIKASQDLLKNKKHPGRDFIFHAGYIAGISAFIGFVPSEDIGIIMLFNQKTKAAMKNGFSFWKEAIE